MLTTLLRRSPALLRRAGLLAGLLILIAGVFGMHLMSGTHSMAATGAVHAAEAFSENRATVGHSGHDGPGAGGGVTESPSVPPSSNPTSSNPAPSEPDTSCSGSGGCAEMAGMGTACIPLPGNGSLTAPLPGSTPFGGVSEPEWPSDRAAYPHVPGSPSPGDLCISRT